MVSETLHTRLKIIASSKGVGLEPMVDDALWEFAKRTPISVPQAPDEKHMRRMLAFAKSKTEQP